MDIALKTINKLNEDGNYKWKHYLWVMDKETIPRTVETVENALIVKEVKEVVNSDFSHDLL